MPAERTLQWGATRCGLASVFVRYPRLGRSTVARYQPHGRIMRMRRLQARILGRYAPVGMTIARRPEEYIRS